MRYSHLMDFRIALPLVAVALFAGCEESAEAETMAEAPVVSQRDGAMPFCELAGSSVADLPSEVRETSGLAIGRDNPDVLWTHNDAGNDPVIYAIDTGGNLLGEVTVDGAELEDWEDIEAGPCPEGNCLFIADIGDNDADRNGVVVYRIPEPNQSTGSSERATEIRVRYPNGPRDAEALFVDRSGTIHLITKGRRGPIELYRFPEAQGGNAEGVLELIGQLLPYPDDNDDRVTAATQSPDGSWIAVRSYRTLYLYPADRLLAGDFGEPITLDLEPLNLEQGESLAISAGGDIWLTSEAESEGEPAWSRISCTFP